METGQFSFQSIQSAAAILHQELPMCQNIASIMPRDASSWQQHREGHQASDGRSPEVLNSNLDRRMASVSSEFILHCLDESNYRFNPILVSGYSLSANHRSIRMLKKSDTKNAGQSPSMGLQRLTVVEATKNPITDYFESVCRVYFSKNKPKDQEVIEEHIQSTFRQTTEVQVNLFNSQETLSNSKESSDVSKMLIKYLQGASKEEISPYKTLIIKDLSNLLKNINTCYIIKHLIKVDPQFRDHAAGVCAAELEDLLEHQHSCRVIYTLCNNSELFRENLLFYFKTKLTKVVSILPGAVLLSLLIHNIQEEDKYSFLFEALEEDNDLIRAEFFGRAFATYMNKCSVQKLDEISHIFSRYVSFMLHNNYGNYLLQIFYERGCEAGKQMCEAALMKIYKKAFVRKYSRYVLLKAVYFDKTGDFTQTMADLIFKDQQLVASIVQKKLSSVILLLCLAKLEKSPRLPSFIAQLRYLKPKLISSKFNVAALEFYKDLRVLESALRGIDVCC